MELLKTTSTAEGKPINTAESAAKPAALKLAAIGYFSTLEKLIEICKKFHGHHEVPLSSIRFDDCYNEDNKFVATTVEELLSGALVGENFTGITGIIAQKDYEAKKTPDKWSVLILNNHHLISAFRKVIGNAKLLTRAPQWLKNAAPKLTVEVVGVPNFLFTSYSKKLEECNQLELKTVMSAVFFEEGKASEMQLVKAVRALALEKKVDSDKQWNNFIRQGILQSRGSSLQYLFLICTAPAELFAEYQNLIQRNKRSGSTERIANTVLETLVLKCLECRNDIGGIVNLLLDVNYRTPILNTSEIIQTIKAYKAPTEAEAFGEVPAFSYIKSFQAQQKRKVEHSVGAPQAKKDRVEEIKQEEPVADSSGSEFQVLRFGSRTEDKQKVVQKVTRPTLYNISRPEVNIKDEFVILDDHHRDNEVGMMERIETNDDEYVECVEEINVPGGPVIYQEAKLIDSLDKPVQLNVNFGYPSSSSREPFYVIGNDEETKIKDEPIITNEETWERDSDQGSDDNSDDQSSSAHSSSYRRKSKSFDAKRELATFKPAIAPRKYIPKPDEEKVNPKYMLKRARNNDAVRRARTKQRELKFQLEAEVNDLRKRVEDLQDELLGAKDVIIKQQNTIASQKTTIQKLMKNNQEQDDNRLEIDES